MLAYDALRGTDIVQSLSNELKADVAARIENDLIRAACEQVLANAETQSNMSPRAWYCLVAAGRVIERPEYVHEVSRRLATFLDKQFFYDGIWCEGSPDYDSQSLNGLAKVLRALEGYSDPANYTDPLDKKRFEKLDLSNAFPSLQLARESLEMWRLPDGRSVPVHDTWPTSFHQPKARSRPYLLPGLGHACMALGEDRDQLQLHLTWSGGYGHSHGDNLSMLLFARQHELLSDLGYTHSAYRSWTLATAAHNTVVIDGVNQSLGNRETPTDGRLIAADFSDPRVQLVSADGARGYPGWRKHINAPCSW